MASEREQWERVQTKTFTNWVNSHLMKRGRKINDLETDLRSGVELINLLEVIGNERIPKYVLNPKMRIQQIENMGKALQFISNHDVKLASIGAEDIVDGNLKLTLGLIWTIILRFAIVGLNEEGLSAKEGLLLWCRRKTEPYDNVDVQDFTVSFQDGLALCALIHRHRPDLIDYASLSNEDKLGNLNLAFNVAHDHLDVPKLLDAEDIVSMPRPDERSIMTYVAQLYTVFSRLDKAETAGRRIGKLTDFKKTVDQLEHDYEQRTSALNEALLAKIHELQNAGLSHDYDGARSDIKDFRDYKASQRRNWVAEQAELAALYGNIQAKLKLNNLPAYATPEGLAINDVESNLERLTAVEKERRAALNSNLRNILDGLRRAFANPANAFYESLVRFRAALAEGGSLDLDAQLAHVKSNNANLAALASDLPAIQAAEDACLAANIDENEYTDHSADDLSFEFDRLSQAYQKQINFIESQVASRAQDGVSAAQIEEFKETYNHFDADKDGSLSRLEFKSCLSSLGVVELDFEGGDKKFEEIFKSVSQGGDTISFDHFVTYMVSITQDTSSPEQLREAFEIIDAGKGFITEQDMRVAQMSDDQIAYLVSAIPRYPLDNVVGYDYKNWLTGLF